MKEEKRSKRQGLREKAQQKEKTNRLRTMGFIFVGVLILILLFISQPLKQITDIVIVQSNPRPNAERNSTGDPKAPIQIVEYSDFQCPFCKRFYTDTETSLMENFVKTGEIYFTYRSTGNWVSHNAATYTGTPEKTELQDAAMAAYCAADQGKFWEMHDALFANNRDVEDQGSFTGQRLTTIAQSIDLDMTAYQSCYDSDKYKDQVQKDFDEAVAANIQGTPSFVITYKVKNEPKIEIIEGAQPITIFQQKIEAALLIADR